MYYTEMQMLLIKLLKCVKWSCTVSEKTAPHGQFGPYLKSIYYMWTLHLQRRGKGIDYIKSPKKNSEEYLLEVKTLIWTDLSKGIKTKKLTQKFLYAGPVANNNHTHDGDQRIKWGSLFASLLALRVESPGSWQTLVSL